MPNLRMKAACLATIGLLAATGLAHAQNFQNPGVSSMKATGAQLAIKSPKVNVCPTPAKMVGWIMTTKPGTVSYMIVRRGGSVSGPFNAEAVPAAKGAMATITRNVTIHDPIDAEYRILVADGTGKVVSNWAPLKASCKIKLGG
jgi:hypothetical protein